MMKIRWLGHACFMLESHGFRFLLDPYHEVPGLSDISAEAEAVSCSHEHFDHAYLDQVRLMHDKENPFTVRKVETFHDPEQGALRGPNTIRCFTADGLTVAHLGDLGHPLSEEQVHAVGHCDAILMPVGGTFTLDAVQAKAEADKLGAKVIIPMHYRQGAVGFEELGTVEEFTDLFPKELVRQYDTNVLELTAETPQQVAVLALPQ